MSNMSVQTSLPQLEMYQQDVNDQKNSFQQKMKNTNQPTNNGQISHQNQNVDFVNNNGEFDNE